MVELFPANKLPVGYTATYNHQSDAVGVEGPTDGEYNGQKAVYYLMYSADSNATCYAYFSADSQEFLGFSGQSGGGGDFDIIDNNGKSVRNAF